MKLVTRQELRGQLRAGKIAPVYLFFGEETYLRDLAVKAVVEKALVDSPVREFSERELSLDSTTIGEALGEARQIPMLGSRLVLKITDVSVATQKTRDSIKESDIDLLERYFSAPSETSVVIFVANELDKRRKVSKLLIEKSVAVEFRRLGDSDTFDWACEIARRGETRINDGSLRYLISRIGNDARKVKLELEKLEIAALPNTEITSQLIDELSPNLRELSNFELTDYLLKRDRSRSLRVLQKILDDGAEPLMLLGLIANNFHRLFLAKEMMEDGRDRSEVASLMRLPYSKQKDFLELARKTSRDEFSSVLRRVAKSDIAIKTSVAMPRLQIEMLICELVRAN